MMLAAFLLASTSAQATAEARLAALDRAAQAQEASLAAEQAPLAQLLATAQRLALRPPAMALAKPGAMDDMVRTRALIAALAPEIRRRTAKLRRQAIATDALRAEAEQTLAIVMAGGTSDTLLAQPSAVAARLAAVPTPDFPATRARPSGVYLLPAAGKLVIGVGERAGIGVRARGITLATHPDAPVIAPAPGRVAYAGPFRGYGDIVILDHGHGWTTILAGLDLVTATSGTLVAAGTQLGHMPGAGARLTIELRHGGRVVDPAAMMLQ